MAELIDGRVTGGISNKLMQDELRLQDLRESVDRSDQLTDNMVIILDSFTTRLKKLDETILPVYDQTLRLTRLQENVEKTLTMLDRVMGYYQVAEEVEQKIREGPSGNIEAYLKLLDRLKVAWDFFKQNNPESIELGHINELQETGLEALVREFLQLLKKHSKPVHVATLHDIAVCEDIEDMPTLELLPVRVINDLKAVAEYLVHAPTENHADIMNMYFQIRSNQLGRALNSLKEANQTQSPLAPNIPKKSSFASSFLKSQTPMKRGNTRRGQQTPAGSGAVETSTSTGSMFDETLEGCSSFMAASTVFLRLIQSESRLMEWIIPLQHQKHVLDNLTKQPIEFFMREGETLFQQAKRSIARHDYTVVISCLRLIRHMQLLLPEYKAVLLGLESNPFQRFPHLLQQFEKLCARALTEDYIQYIKVDSEKQSNLPKDGTVHELTSSSLWFIEQLLDYSRNVGEIMLGQSTYAISSTDQERRKALGQYLVRVLDALNLNLENKARSYESPQLAAVFLLNNFQFIHKTFTRNTQMLKLLEDVFKDIEEHYIGLITQQGRDYQKGFHKLISFLGQEVTLIGISPGDKLNNQKRQLLKDKFKGFNMELEELHRIQEQWSIPDPQLRSRLRNDNIEMLGQLYSEFHRMYASLPFTKNAEKYLKYTPESFEDKLKSFFDGGAP